jgi:hypothetical protein
MTLHSGINAKAFAGTATADKELPLISWSVNPGAEQQTFRNSKTGRFTVREVTFFDCNFTVVVDFDFAANPFLPANGGLSVVAGATVASRLYTNGTSSAYWDFASASVLGAPMSVSVEGKPALAYNLGANGVFVEPAA